MVGLIVIDYRNEKAQLRISTIATARALGLALDRQVAQTRSTLQALAMSAPVDGSGLEHFSELAVRLREQIGVTNIVLITPDGRQVLNTHAPRGQAPPGVVTSPELMSMFKTGVPVVTDLFFGQVSGSHMVAVGVPVVHENNVIYALNAGLTPDALRGLLLKQQLPDGWIAAILDGDGTVIARTREQSRFVGTRVSRGFREQIARVGEGALDSVALDGTAVLTTFSHVRDAGWTVVIGIPQEILNRELRRSLGWVVGWTLALVAFSLSLGLLLARKLTASTESLMRAAVQLGRAEEVTLEPVSFKEAAALGTALRVASSDLLAVHTDLRDSEQRLKAILQHANDGVLALSAERAVVLSNPAAERMFGYLDDEMTGLPLELLLPPRYRETLLADVGRLSAIAEQSGAAGAKFSVFGLRRDRSEFPVEISLSKAMQDGQDFYVLILNDVTERQRVHDALLRSNMDLQQFAFVAAHDLRSPLRSIKGYMGILRAKYAAQMHPIAIDMIDRADNAVAQMDHLTDDLLSYARVGQQAKPFADVDCNSVLKDTLQLLDAAIRESHAHIEVASLPTVMGDRVQLIQLFQNLLGNALKYSGGEPPRIQVRAERGANETVFSIDDHGIGIASQYHERIFEIFKRLHTAREYAGSGVGLSICQRIVQHHGGRIWVESVPGEGSTFFFSIPDKQVAPS